MNYKRNTIGNKVTVLTFSEYLKNEIMKKQINFTLIFFLFTSIIFAQYNKSDLKKIKRLKKKYDFISADNNYFKKPTNCLNIIAGEFSKGPSDGGGGYNKAIKNLRKIDIKGNVIENISSYYITLPFSHNHKKYKDLIRIKSYNNNLVGIMNNCGEVILKPTYDHINAFNEQGLAVCFKSNNIQVIDKHGKPVLKEMLPYDVDYNSFWTIPTPGEINKLAVIGQSLIVSNGTNYGLYNVMNNENLTEFEYSKIKIKPINFNSNKYFKAKKNGKYTLIEVETGEILIPPVFHEIKSISNYNGKNYVEGKTNNGENYNIYDIEKKEFIFPRNMEFSEARTITGEKDKWIIIDKKNTWSTGLYDTKSKTFLIEFDQNISNISTSSLNNTVQINYKNSNNDVSKLFDFKKSELMSLKVGKKYSPKKIKLKSENKEVTFLNYQFQPDSKSTVSMYNIIYDHNWNIIVENVRVRGLKTKGDLFYFYEIVDGVKKYTAYNILGELVGEKRNFKP